MEEKITIDDLIAEGKRCFNFHPDEDIKSLSCILELALNNYANSIEGFRAYLSMVNYFAKDMAKYIDSID